MSKNFIFVLNCGSSSIKFSVIDTDKKRKYIAGVIDSLFLKNTNASWIINKICYKQVLPEKSNHEFGIKFIFFQIILKNQDIFNKITAISHRVVHGGEEKKIAVFVTKKVLQYIKEMSCFSPLHNPINLLGIKLSINIFPNLAKKNIAIFDTSFHQTIPKTSYLYAIPYKFYKNNKIRRYGAHGISHQYARDKTSSILNKSVNKLNIITCHLGSGSSITAIYKGKSIDTSMGLTPLEGLVMGTRSGDIDPAIIFYMHNVLKMKIHDIYEILTFKSGLLGLNKVSSDCRYATDNYFTNKYAKNSIDIFCYRLSKYISAYSCALNGRIDAVIFTGGIGENSALIRKITISKLSLLGLFIDENANTSIRKNTSGFINKKKTIPILVIPSKEETIMVQETIKLL